MSDTQLLVKANRGHAQVNADLGGILGNTQNTNRAGFFAQIRSDGGLDVKFLSGVINPSNPNFAAVRGVDAPVRLIPPQFQEQILDIISLNTGRQVHRALS